MVDTSRTPEHIQYLAAVADLQTRTQRMLDTLNSDAVRGNRDELSRVTGEIAALQAEQARLDAQGATVTGPTDATDALANARKSVTELGTSLAQAGFTAEGWLEAMPINPLVEQAQQMGKIFKDIAENFSTGNFQDEKEVQQALANALNQVALLADMVASLAGNTTQNRVAPSAQPVAAPANPNRPQPRKETDVLQGHTDPKAQEDAKKRFEAYAADKQIPKRLEQRTQLPEDNPNRLTPPTRQQQVRMLVGRIASKLGLEWGRKMVLGAEAQRSGLTAEAAAKRDTSVTDKINQITEFQADEKVPLDDLLKQYKLPADRTLSASEKIQHEQQVERRMSGVQKDMLDAYVGFMGELGLLKPHTIPADSRRVVDALRNNLGTTDAAVKAYFARRVPDVLGIEKYKHLELDAAPVQTQQTPDVTGLNPGVTPPDVQPPAPPAPAAQPDAAAEKAAREARIQALEAGYGVARAASFDKLLSESGLRELRQALTDNARWRVLQDIVNSYGGELLKRAESEDDVLNVLEQVLSKKPGQPNP